MNKDLTEVVFILDRSGSMHGSEKDVIGGFNSTIEKQKQEEGQCLISTVLFSNDSKVIHDRVPIKEIKNMDSKDYVTGGCTALIDALGNSIHYIKKVHKVIREEDRPAHTLFIITTDGLENASHQYSSDEVKKMIERQQEAGWQFIYLAANIDAVESSKAYGFKPEAVHDFICDDKGNQLLFQCMNEAISGTRKNKKNKAIDSFASLDQDFQKRKK